MTRARRPRVCLFLGPSLSAGEARQAFGAVDADLDILPPAEQGDILRLMERLPDVIGIVDGAFFHVPSLLHREILLAIEQGVGVLGASSLGALRAAELDELGMEGIGTVYDWYRTGAIDGDDEVAVLHTPADQGYRPLTEALVNVRYTLDCARRRGAVSATHARHLLAIARRLHFTERTYRSILAQTTALTDDQHHRLSRFLEHEAIDLKRQDALALVRTVAGRLGSSRSPSRTTSARVAMTTHFERCRSEYIGYVVDGVHVPTALAVAIQKLLNPSSPRLWRRVQYRCLALDEARHRGIIAEEPEILAERFWRHRPETDDGARAAWLEERLLTQDELIAALQERRLEELLLKLYRHRHPMASGRAALFREIARDVAIRLGIPGQTLPEPLLMYPGMPWSQPLIHEMKLRGALRPALAYASRILRSTYRLRRDPRSDVARMPAEELARYVARTWGIDPVQIRQHRVARGFTRYGELLEAAGYVWMYEQAKTRPDGVDDFLD